MLFNNKVFTLRNKKKVLLVTHELSNTGAPRALLAFAKALQELDISITLISYKNGALKRDFLKLNIPVFIVKAKILKLIFPLLNIYDLVICNTLITFHVINLLKQNRKVYWWIHEAALIDEYINNNKKKKLLLKAMENCKNLYCVSEYSKQFINKYNPNAKILMPIINDEFAIFKKNQINKKITICYFGELIPLKGQDIFINYFLELPEEIRNKFYIQFIGRICDSEFYKKLQDMTKNLSNVKYLGDLSHDKAMDILSKSDIFALFSRGDSFSIATAEALMMNKPVIISENVGIAPIIETEFCGKIIKNKEEFCNLFEKIDNINFNSPRETFLKNFSSVAYKHYLQDIFKQYL